MSAIQDLVDDFRRGRVDAKRIDAAIQNGYETFDLETAVGVRPSLFRNRLAFSDTELATMSAQIKAAPDAGKRIGLEVLPDPQTVIPKTQEDDHWASREDLQPLDDVCTKFCTKKYFPDAFARINMIANVVALFTRAAAMGRQDYKIIFKGGVMIRLVLLEWLHDMPAESRDAALQYISSKQKGVGLSDFDFEISPNHESPRADVVRRMKLFNYLVLMRLQRVVEDQLEGKAPSTMLDVSWDRAKGATELKEALQAQIDTLDASHPMHKCRIDHVVLSGKQPATVPKGYRMKSGASFPPPRKNFFIFKCKGEANEDRTCVAPAASVYRMLGVPRRNIENAGSHLYCTHNTHIGEGEERKHPDQLLGVFHLLRIKHTFVVFYTTPGGEKRIDRLAGEMVDLSQSLGSAHDEIHAALYKRVATPYASYRILSVGGFEMYSYSSEGFLTDHQFMLHNRDVPPWKTAKLEKRLLRYVTFLLCYVLSANCAPRVSMGEKIGALRTLAAAVRRLPTTIAPSISTTVRAVDAFYAREVRSLRIHGTRGAKPYFEIMHEHLSHVLAICEGAHAQMSRPAWKPLVRLNPVHLEHASEFHYVQ